MSTLIPVFYYYLLLFPLFSFLNQTNLHIIQFFLPPPSSFVIVSSCKPPTCSACKRSNHTCRGLHCRHCAETFLGKCTSGHHVGYCVRLAPLQRTLTLSSTPHTHTHSHKSGFTCANKRDNPILCAHRLFFHARRVMSRPLLALCPLRWRYSFRSGTDMSTYPSCCDTWFQYCRARDCSLPFISSSRYAHVLSTARGKKRLV